MAELATIARPYADALFKAATAGAGMDLASTADWVDELAALQETLACIQDEPSWQYE